MKFKILYDLDREQPRPFLLTRIGVDRRRGNQRNYVVVDAFKDYAEAENAVPSYNGRRDDPSYNRRHDDPQED